MGEDLGDLSLEDLHRLEQKMDASVGLVRERKVGVWNISLIGFNWFDGSAQNRDFQNFISPFFPTDDFIVHENKLVASLELFFGSRSFKVSQNKISS